eukprot:11857-Heterococcus_DN1.PRE.1
MMYSCNVCAVAGVDQVQGGGATSESDYTHVARLRGLPWNTTHEDIAKFISDVTLDEDAIWLLHNARDEAYVKVTSEEALDAILLHDNEMIGKRNIEVLVSSPEDMETARANSKIKGHADAVYQHVLRMNGLPWSTRNEDVRKFFKECSVIDDLDGIHICINKEGRPSGDAYVIFETEQDVATALKKNKDTMEGRWIELFDSTKSDMGTGLQQTAAAGRNELIDHKEVYKALGAGKDAGFSGVLKLRGIPFTTTKAQVRKFFEEFGVEDKSIFIVTRVDGKPSGEAFAVFKDEEESRVAMQKLDKKKLGD